MFENFLLDVATEYLPAALESAVVGAATPAELRALSVRWKSVLNETDQGATPLLIEATKLLPEVKTLSEATKHFCEVFSGVAPDRIIELEPFSTASDVLRRLLAPRRP